MPFLLSVAALSAAALAYEVWLVRAFAIAQWHHFAYMIISIALLGYGASGTFLVFVRDRFAGRLIPGFALGAVLFGITAPAGYMAVRALPLNALEILWDPYQPLYLLVVYVALAFPFFCAAGAIGLALTQRPKSIGRIYCADLLGAGAGALAIVGALFLIPTGDCLGLIAGLGFAAAALALISTPHRRNWGFALMVPAIAGAVLWPADWGTPNPSPYKELSAALRVPGRHIVAERHSPLAWLAVVDSGATPFRHAPGLSLARGSEPPPQLGVFADGGAMTAINRFDGDLKAAAYLDAATAALPYHLLRQPRVLVLGAGGGSDLLLARYHDAAKIDAVEVNGDMVDLVGSRFAGFAGNLYQTPNITVHVADARGFVAAEQRRFDLIQIALLDSFSAAASGLHALNESTLYTVEAFRSYVSRLSPGGMLAITRWLSVPPRDGLRLFATAAQALRSIGVEEPGRRLALIRSWKTTTLIVKNGPLTAPDLKAIRSFCADRSFDIAFLPGMTADEANRFNLLDRPHFFEGATALLGPDREAFLKRYKFNVAPTTDDRPYFFHFLKWQTVGELLGMGSGGLHLLEAGSLMLAATLLQAALLGTVLILLPLTALRRDPAAESFPPLFRTRISIYFLAIGLAFLFVEIAFIQRFVLLLGHPIYAVAVVLAGFLVFAGLGSGAASILGRRIGISRRSAVRLATMCIGVLATLNLVIAPGLFEALHAWPQPAKVAVALGFIGPMAFFMGMPFPLGLAQTADRAPALIPWAWGINGCASVISAVLATMLALHFGFAVVLLLALGLYAMAALCLSR